MVTAAPLELTREQARRVAVHAQLLDAERPASLAEAFERIGSTQVDMTPYLAPSAQLVAWSRLGDALTAADFAEALTGRELVELRGYLHTADDLPLHYAEMATWPGEDPPAWVQACADWVEANDLARAEILAQLEEEGPLPAAALSAEFVVPWRSSGWNAGKNVGMMLLRLEERGEVAVARREHRTGIWDLAERVWPPADPVPLEEARRIRARRRLAALGIARPTSRRTPVEKADVDATGPGVPAVVEGVRGRWLVDPDRLDEGFAPRTALLSPLDPLVFDRKRMSELFEFEYLLEMYKPAAQRRWGYWALPVLHGDRLVGKVDVEARADDGLLMVHAIHEDGEWDAATRDAVVAELEGLGRHAGLPLAWA